MPSFPAPSVGDTFFSVDAKIGQSDQFGNSPNGFPDTFSIGNSEDQTIKPDVISPVYYPYAPHYVPVVKLNATYDIPDAPCIVLADASSGNITLTLPSAAWASGKTVTIMRYDSTANTVTIATSDGNIRTTASIGSILNTQYGAVDYTAATYFDGTTTDTIWIGR